MFTLFGFHILVLSSMIFILFYFFMLVLHLQICDHFNLGLRIIVEIICQSQALTKKISISLF